MGNNKYSEILARTKALLKESLNDTNLDLITSLDKALDELSDAHKLTEEDLSSTKDKLIEVVKNTSFKDDSTPFKPVDQTQEEPMSLDDALASAIEETMNQRK